MSQREEWEARTEKILSPIAKEKGVEIYDVEYVKEGSNWYLRCYIDKDTGVDINDCEAVSRALSDELDKEDFIQDAYILEVSSPGLGRQLKKDKHLQKSLGQEVEVRTYKPPEGYREKEFTGILKAFDALTLTVLPDPEDPLKELVLERKNIAVVRLTFDF